MQGSVVKIGVPKECFPRERRVALVPLAVPTLTKKGAEIYIQSLAGEAAGYPDHAYEEKGARILGSRREVFEQCDLILQVRGVGSNPETAGEDFELFRAGLTVVGFHDPLTSPGVMQEVAHKGVTLFAMELMPRITRAQAMDALSAMSTVAGYKAMLLAAGRSPKMFPLMMTAAGTVTPARVFVIGAGVAGLTAIATARRLGAVVKAYDVRPAAKEQVESLGASFVALGLESQDKEDRGGYAREMDAEFYRKQRQLMTEIIASHDVVVTTAAVPGKKAPVLITSVMIDRMAPGSVIVDLAAERGGNCEETRPGEDIVVKGVTIMGPVNLPATVPYHASQMYAKNISNFVAQLIHDGQLKLNTEDEIVRETLVTKGGEVVHPKIVALLTKRKS